MLASTDKSLVTLSSLQNGSHRAMDHIPLQGSADQLQLALWLFPLGVLVLALTAAIYLRRRSPVSGSSVARRISLAVGLALGIAPIFGSIYLMMADSGTVVTGWEPWRSELQVTESAALERAE